MRSAESIRAGAGRIDKGFMTNLFEPLARSGGRHAQNSAHNIPRLRNLEECKGDCEIVFMAKPSRAMPSERI
jgi:hypothetical protein